MKQQLYIISSDIYILIHNYYALIAYVICCMFCTTMKLAIDETPQYDGLTT